MAEVTVKPKSSRATQAARREISRPRTSKPRAREPFSRRPVPATNLEDHGAGRLTSAPARVESASPLPRRPDVPATAGRPRRHAPERRTQPEWSPRQAVLVLGIVERGETAAGRTAPHGVVEPRQARHRHQARALAGRTAVSRPARRGRCIECHVGRPHNPSGVSAKTLTCAAGGTDATNPAWLAPGQPTKSGATSGRGNPWSPLTLVPSASSTHTALTPRRPIAHPTTSTLRPTHCPGRANRRRCSRAQHPRPRAPPGPGTASGSRSAVRTAPGRSGQSPRPPRGSASRQPRAGSGRPATADRRPPTSTPRAQTERNRSLTATPAGFPRARSTPRDRTPQHPTRRRADPARGVRACGGPARRHARRESFAPCTTGLHERYPVGGDEHPLQMLADVGGGDRGRAHAIEGAASRRQVARRAAGLGPEHEGRRSHRRPLKRTDLPGEHVDRRHAEPRGQVRGPLMLPTNAWQCATWSRKPDRPKRPVATRTRSGCPLPSATRRARSCSRGAPYSTTAASSNSTTLAPALRTTTRATGATRRPNPGRCQSSSGRAARRGHNGPRGGEEPAGAARARRGRAGQGTHRPTARADRRCGGRGPCPACSRIRAGQSTCSRVLSDRKPPSRAPGARREPSAHRRPASGRVPRRSRTAPATAAAPRAHRASHDTAPRPLTSAKASNASTRRTTLGDERAVDQLTRPRARQHRDLRVWQRRVKAPDRREAEHHIADVIELDHQHMLDVGGANGAQRRAMAHHRQRVRLPRRRPPAWRGGRVQRSSRRASRRCRPGSSCAGEPNASVEAASANSKSAWGASRVPARSAMRTRGPRRCEARPRRLGPTPSSVRGGRPANPGRAQLPLSLEVRSPRTRVARAAASRPTPSRPGPAVAAGARAAPPPTGSR